MPKQLTLEETFRRQLIISRHSRLLQASQHQSLFFVQSALDNCTRAVTFRLDCDNDYRNGLNRAQQLHLCDIVCSLNFYQHLSELLQERSSAQDSS
jgi:hypothetical protein